MTAPDDVTLRGRLLAAGAVLSGAALDSLVRHAERLVEGRAPRCTRCRAPGHNRRTCTGQTQIPGAFDRRRAA